MGEVGMAHQRDEPAREVLPLTPTGKKQLLRERDRWAQLVAAIGGVLNPRSRERLER